MGASCIRVITVIVNQCEFRVKCFTFTSPASAASSLGRVVDEQRVEGQAVGQDEVAHVVAADTQRVQIHRLLVLQRHLHRLEVRVHAHVHTCKQQENADSA